MYVCIYINHVVAKLLFNTIAVKSSILLKFNLIAYVMLCMYIYFSIDMINLLYDNIIDDLMN